MEDTENMKKRIELKSILLFVYKAKINELKQTYPSRDIMQFLDEKIIELELQIKVLEMPDEPWHDLGEIAS